MHHAKDAKDAKKTVNRMRMNQSSSLCALRVLSRNDAEESGWNGPLARSRRQLAAEFRHSQRSNQSVCPGRSSSGGRAARRNRPVARSTQHQLHRSGFNAKAQRRKDAGREELGWSADLNCVDLRGDERVSETNSQCQWVECKLDATTRAFSLPRRRGEGGRRPDEGWGRQGRRTQPLTPTLSPPPRKGEGASAHRGCPAIPPNPIPKWFGTDQAGSLCGSASLRLCVESQLPKLG